jgi:LRR receptor-like serine/threonine-protein kinase FLS2
LFLYENPFTGSIPSCIGQFEQLEVFYWFLTNINGPIPTEIGLLASLTELPIMLNSLSGTLPTEVGDLRAMSKFYISQNQLTGPIPWQITMMTQTSFLDLSANLLTRTLPGGVNTMPNLEYLFLYQNSLSGQLPVNWMVPCQFIEFDADVNMFTGSIPMEIYSCSQLKLLYINNNYLTGTVSESMYDLTGLVVLFFNTNYLSGTLAENAFQLVKLQKYLISGNLFTGSIPSTFANGNPYLKEFDIHGNAFTGTLPMSIGVNKSLLKTFDVSLNLLTGALPQTIWYCVNILRFNVSYNYFVGSVSNVIGTWRFLESYSVKHNLFSALVPVGLGDKSFLQSVSSSDNFFTGPVPAELAECAQLISLTLDNNFLSRSIPVTFGQLAAVQYLNLSQNLLTGGVGTVFSNSSFPALVTVNLAASSLTGRLPEQLFVNHPNLSDVVMFSNCFSGSLPTSICEAKGLTVLVLDSITSGPACDVQFTWPARSLFHVVIGRRKLQGSIPNCMWSMSALTSLHLSSNGLTGTLGELLGPDNAHPAYLQDIEISSNRLVGTLPTSWQLLSTLKNLDLSSNKLSGTLSDFFQVNQNASIDLSVNRLFGHVPAAFLQGSGVAAGLQLNILNENLFQCHTHHMPPSDPAAKTYVCGSNNLNDSLFVMMAAILLVPTVVFCMCLQRYLRNDVLSRAGSLAPKDVVHEVVDVDQGLASIISQLKDPLLELRPVLHVMVHFCDRLQQYAKFMSLAALFSLVVPMLSYVLLKTLPSLSNLYSTHTYQYTWVTSVAYMHGTVPVVLVSFYILLLVAMCRYTEGHAFTEYRTEELGHTASVSGGPATMVRIWITSRFTLLSSSSSMYFTCMRR